MFGRFGWDAGSMIAVEISHAAVRVQQCVEPLPPGAWDDPRTGDREAVAQALRRALAASGRKGRRASVCISSARVIERRLSLPAGLDDAQIDERLRAALEASVPFPVDDAALDFGVLGPCPDDAGAREVVCSLCQPDDLEPLVAVLELAGLEACKVSPDNAPLVNLLPWRQWRVERRARRFFRVLGGTAVLVIAGVAMVDARFSKAGLEQAAQREQERVLQEQQAYRQWVAQLPGRLSQVAPDGVRFTEVTVEGRQFSLSGVGPGEGLEWAMELVDASLQRDGEAFRLQGRVP